MASSWAYSDRVSRCRAIVYSFEEIIIISIKTCFSYFSIFPLFFSFGITDVSILYGSFKFQGKTEKNDQVAFSLETYNREGGGSLPQTPQSLFFPSLGQSVDGHFLSEKPFLKSDSCGFSGCHSDIYMQWESSAHRFASMNNPFYKKTVEKFGRDRGVAATKFCGGCHDPLLLFSGQMDHPIDPETPQAQAGITCLSCHGIQKILDARGNGSYQLDAPEEYPFAKTENPFFQSVHRFLIRVKPDMHRRNLLKPVHKTSDFCGACHKVSLDQPVNGYRWKRGQNELDDWQMSAFSGEISAPMGIPPESPQACGTCHMPLISSNDMGNRNGKVHNHRFAAANSALPYLRNDSVHLKEIEDFLKNQKVTLDLVALRREGETSKEEDENSKGGPLPLKWVFPVDARTETLECEQTYIFELLVKNQKVGHSFPGGTIDAQEVWIEFRIIGEDGQKIFHNGFLKEDGTVDPEAHFYGALLLDKAGNPVLHRNVQDWVALGYKNVISPGGSDLIHYRVKFPKDCGELIQVKAALHYRKFHLPFSKFVFGPQTRPPVSYQNLPVLRVSEFSAPIRVMTLRTSGSKTDSDKRIKTNLERLNAYGLGLFLQKDYVRAEQVFRKLLNTDESHQEGRVRLIRVLIAQGAFVEARNELEKLFQIDPSSIKGAFLSGRVEKEFGNYEKAVERLAPLSDRFKKDRVLLKLLANIYLLQGDYLRASHVYQKVLEIDPEDREGRYNMALAQKGLGNEEISEREMAFYLKYKEAEEESALAGKFRKNNPLYNREGQAIHIHD